MANVSGIGLEGLGFGLSSGVSVSKADSIMDYAFSLYGVFDYVGSGGKIVRMYNASVTPNEKDFTEAELYGSEFTNWNTSGTPKVAKFYDQMGRSENDLYGISVSNYVEFFPTEKEVYFTSSGYFQYSTFRTDRSDSVEKAFNANIGTGNDTTIVMSSRKTGDDLQDLPASGRSFIGMRNPFSPTTLLNTSHKAMMIKAATYSTVVQISAEADNGVLVQENGNDAVSLTNNLRTYAVDISRIAVSGVTANHLDLWVNGNREIEANTTDLSDQMTIGYLQVGDNKMRSQGFAFFNRRLTSDEHSEVHNIFSANY